MLKKFSSYLSKIFKFSAFVDYIPILRKLVRLEIK